MCLKMALNRNFSLFFTLYSRSVSLSCWPLGSVRPPNGPPKFLWRSFSSESRHASTHFSRITIWYWCSRLFDRITTKRVILAKRPETYRLADLKLILKGRRPVVVFPPLPCLLFCQYWWVEWCQSGTMIYARIELTSGGPSFLPLARIFQWLVHRVCLSMRLDTFAWWFSCDHFRTLKRWPKISKKIIF